MKAGFTKSPNNLRYTGLEKAADEDVGVEGAFRVEVSLRTSSECGKDAIQESAFPELA